MQLLEDIFQLFGYRQARMRGGQNPVMRVVFHQDPAYDKNRQEKAGPELPSRKKRSYNEATEEKEVPHAVRTL